MLYLLCVERLAPGHIKSTHQVHAADSKLCYSKFSHVVVVLGSRQSPLYNRDLNYQFNFKSKFGKPINDKDDSPGMIHLLNLSFPMPGGGGGGVEPTPSCFS